MLLTIVLHQHLSEVTRVTYLNIQGGDYLVQDKFSYQNHNMKSPEILAFNNLFYYEIMF